MKKRFVWLGVAATLALGLFALAACNGSSPLGGPEGSSSAAQEQVKVGKTQKVTCENGVMLGKSEDGVTSFKGVPYAKPPVGELRWKAPQAPDPSSKEIECYDFGYTALQAEWPTQKASYYPKSEDCLTLNIWENNKVADSKEPKPVMVFIHGGAFGWGGTTDPAYDGQNFAKAHDDVILVTCNYRLGLMAFPDFSTIEGGEGYTDINLALRDQIAALQWVQRNIAEFGGDPNNVTIFGESAGSWSVTALTISPKARGLFKRAIAQSGEVAPKGREAAQQYATAIMEAAGAKNMKDLLAVSGDEWLKINDKNRLGDENCYVVADGDVIPEDLDQAFKDAAASGVQLIVGSNEDEWNFFKEDAPGATEDEKLRNWAGDMDAMYDVAYKGADDEGKAALEELLKYEEGLVPEEYARDPKVRDALAKSGFVSETWRYEIMDFADRFANAGGDTHAYLLKVPSTRDDMYRSSVHAVELAYVFNNVQDDDQYAGKVDPAVAAKMQESWTNFAKTGDPSVEGAVWAPYNTDTRDTMVIDTDKWECVSDPTKTARELLVKAYGSEPYRVW